MNTKKIGDITVVQVVAKLMTLGHTVLAPILSDNQRYDLVLENDGTFERVQCKTGKLKDGCVTFATASSYAHRGGKRKNYRGQIESFAVYCPENKEIYLVPVSITGDATCSLRIEPVKSNQQYKINWAKDYKI